MDADADVESFERFFAEQERDLLRYCWGLTLDRDDARDVAQEAMTRAWREWDRLAGTNPVGWLRTVALNLVRERWRTRQRDTRLVERLRARRDEPSAPPDLDDSMVDALRALPAKQREAVVLHHLSDLPVDEVAAIMGIAVPSVKTHLQRGRAALASAIPDSRHVGTPRRSRKERQR